MAYMVGISTNWARHRCNESNSNETSFLHHDISTWYELDKNPKIHHHLPIYS